MKRSDIMPHDDSAKPGAPGVSYERREDFRLDDTLPIHHSPMHASGENDASKIAGMDVSKVVSDLKAANLPESLITVLKAIDDKLNALMEIGAAPAESATGQAAQPRLKALNISAGGLSFRSEKAYKMNEVLKITLGIPPRPYTMINVLGEVVRCDKRKDGNATYFDIGLRYMHLDEDNRQDITRYLFDVQRKRVQTRHNIL
jgi:hypothetical protein